MAEQDEDASRDSQSGPDGKGGFLGASDRPYKGNMPGQLENRGVDSQFAGLVSESKAEEARLLAIGEGRNSQHGNVGFAGNYSIGAEVEK